MQYDFTVPANGGQVLDVKGKFFKFKSGTGAIRVKTNHGGYVDLLPGQGVWNTDFSSLVIQDKSGAINAGVILAGDFDFHDDRITGTVDVTDGGRIRTLAGQAMMITGGCGQTAGTYAAWQLMNPAGSGKRISISAYSFTASQAGAVVLFTSSAALPAYNNQGVSKLIPLVGTTTSSAAQLRQENRVNPNAVGAELPLDFANIQANVTFTRNLKEPLVLMPGAGVHMVLQILATSINGTWEWVEEPLQ